jgi:AraC-like DNA-binding protein
VLFLRRGAGQNQFSTALSFQGSSRIPLRELPVYVLEHLRDPLTVEGLAKRVSISVRNFSRVFVKEFGVTPAAFIERLRIETAKRLVEESSRGLEEIATECGLGTLDKVGDLAGVGCMVYICGRCPCCQEGLEQFCENGFTGIFGSQDKIGGTPQKRWKVGPGQKIGVIGLGQMGVKFAHAVSK